MIKRDASSSLRTVHFQLPHRESRLSQPEAALDTGTSIPITRSSKKTAPVFQQEQVTHDACCMAPASQMITRYGSLIREGDWGRTSIRYGVPELDSYTQELIQSGWVDPATHLPTPAYFEAWAQYPHLAAQLRDIFGSK